MHRFFLSVRPKPECAQFSGRRDRRRARFAKDQAAADTALAATPRQCRRRPKPHASRTQEAIPFTDANEGSVKHRQN
jgi:hypothetical protein